MRDFKLLLIEHDAFDTMCFKRALLNLGLNNDVMIAGSASQAVTLFLNQNTQESLERPYIIFCDVDMPESNGVDFLSFVRANSLLKNTIFYLCSSSFRREDIARARFNKVSGFINKFQLERGLSVTLKHLNMSRRLAA